MTDPNRSLPSKKRAFTVLTFLIVVSILSYIDRQVLFAILPLIKRDLVLSDAQLGALASAFMLVYMVSAPFIAWSADRTGRVKWIGSGILAWSVATLSGGLATVFPALMLSRAAVGVGEASFGSISPSFAAEHFPSSYRGRALGLLSMAIPVGSALGYILGGFVGQHYGWRHAFFLAGTAGIPLGVAAFWLRDPNPRQSRDSAPVAAYAGLFRNRTFVIDTFAMAAVTFTLGGIAVWMPTFLSRQWNLSVARAGTIFGGLTVLTGLAGSLTGGWLADRLLKKTRASYFLVSAVGFGCSAPFAALSLYSHRFPIAIASLAAAEFFIFLSTGPLNAVITEVTPLAARTMAFAVNIFIIHALGDAASPFVIGLVSDAFNLRMALFGSLVFLIIGAALCVWGMRSYAMDVTLAEKIDEAAA
jgi:predicted MFS family arabinose efflux permease